MCLAQGPQRGDAGEARTRGPSSTLPLGHCAPYNHLSDIQIKCPMGLAIKWVKPFGLNMKTCLEPQSLYTSETPTFRPPWASYL